MRAYPLTTYFVMADVVITSSQPSTHACIYNAYRAACNRIQAIRRGLARALELRRKLPRGLTMCSLLFVLVALITYGDEAINDDFAHLHGEAETQAVYTSVLLSSPAMAAANAKTRWLGDTGAGMHCITNSSLA
eukprot:4525882-Pleurochrysis_carterae.AAC.1